MKPSTLQIMSRNGVQHMSGKARMNVTACLRRRLRTQNHQRSNSSGHPTQCAVPCHATAYNQQPFVAAKLFPQQTLVAFPKVRRFFLRLRSPVNRAHVFVGIAAAAHLAGCVPAGPLTAALFFRSTLVLAAVAAAGTRRRIVLQQQLRNFVLSSDWAWLDGIPSVRLPWRSTPACLLLLHCIWIDT